MTDKIEEKVAVEIATLLDSAIQRDRAIATRKVGTHNSDDFCAYVDINKGNYPLRACKGGG